MFETFIVFSLPMRDGNPKIYDKNKLPDRGIGMKKALNLLNIPLEGKHHRAIDDAKNISKIFLYYYDKWSFVKN